VGFFCAYFQNAISLTTSPLASFEKTPPLPRPPPRTRWKDDDDDDDDGGEEHHESTRFDDAIRFGAFGVVVVVEVVLEHRLAFGSKRRSNPMRLFERDRKRFEHRDERERERERS